MLLSVGGTNGRDKLQWVNGVVWEVGLGPGCTAEPAESLVEVLYASAALDSF